VRVLLLNPPCEYTASLSAKRDDASGRGIIEVEDFGVFPPLGLLYILASLKQKTPQYNLFFLDCVAEGIGHQDLAAKIAEINPDVTGITSFTTSMYDVCLAARTVRMVSPDGHLCLGGHHPITFPVEAAELPEFDSIIIGEGEFAFPELVDCLAAGRDFTSIPGVYTKESIQKYRDHSAPDSRFLSSVMAPPAYIHDLDLLPPPDRSVISHLDYRSIVGATRHLTTMITSRGCPCRCTYCNVPYKDFRQRSLISVADEIKDCLDMGYTEVHFYDDLFNINPERVIGFCDEIKRRGYRFIWDFRGRVNGVTWESLVRAKEAGCRMITFGVETGSDEGLRQLKKNTTTEEVRRVFSWCRSLGILTVADFMIGLPFEKSAADIQQSIDFLLEIDPDYAQILILALYPATELFTEAARRGLIDPGRWNEFAKTPTPGFQVDHWEEFLTVSQLQHLQKDACRRFYLRPRYIWRSLISTCSWHEFTSKLQGAVKLYRS
jgi:radical SAM superfamily enzyme YgiQ (UPF0313 family)